MAKLTKTDRETLRSAEPWVQSPTERSPRIMEDTPEARARYCRWANEAAKFFKGTKPVNFTGKHWKL